MIKLMSLSWNDRVAKIREIITYSNSHLRAHMKDIAVVVDVEKCTVRDVLRNFSHKRAIKETGMIIELKDYKKYSHRSGLLTSLEITMTVADVNMSKTLDEALSYNPYREKHDERLYLWNREVVKTLWKLKQRKNKLFDTARE